MALTLTERIKRANEAARDAYGADADPLEAHLRVLGLERQLWQWRVINRWPMPVWLRVRWGRRLDRQASAHLRAGRSEQELREHEAWVREWPSE